MPSRAGRTDLASLRTTGDPRARRNAQRQTLNRAAEPVADLPPGATAAQIVARFNTLLRSLRDAGVLRK